MKTTRKFRRKTRKSRRKYKKRGGSGFDRQAFQRSQFISDPEYRRERFSNFKKNILNTTQRAYNRGRDFYRKFNNRIGRPPTRGEQKEIDDATAAEEVKNKEINDRKKDMKENYVELDGQILYDEFDKIKEDVLLIKEDVLLIKAVFYKFDDNYNKIELGKLTGIDSEEKNINLTERYSYDMFYYYLIFDKTKKEPGYTKRQYHDEIEPIFKIKNFYVHKDDLKNPKYNEDKLQQSGGKKRRKSRRKRKMKGGSLMGTDILTGLNTTDTNSVLAFGTSGGTKYMLNELKAGPVESGPYLSSRTDVNPNLA